MKPITFGAIFFAYVLLMTISIWSGNWLAAIGFLCAALTMAEVE